MKRALRLGFAIALVCAVGILGMVMLRVQSSSRRVDSSKASVELVVSSLRRYRADHGAYPDTLASLTPTYLASIPKSEFGTPLAYTKTENQDDFYIVFYENPQPGFFSPSRRYIYYSSGSGGWRMEEIEL